MKNWLIFILMLAFVPPVNGDNSNTVPVTKQITRYQSSLIPDKTDEMKIDNLELDTTGQYAQLALATQDVLQQIVAINYESPFFKVSAYPNAENKTMLYVQSCDIMQEDAQGRKMLMGVVKIKNCYFVVQKRSQSGSIVENLFKKGRGKIEFERVFEYVEEPLTLGGTLFLGIWNGQKQGFDANEFTVNGDDLLHPSTGETPPEGEPDTQD